MAAPSTGTSLESALPIVQFQGLNTAKAVNLDGTQIDTSGNVTVAGTLGVTGSATFTSSVTVTGTMTQSGGETIVGNPTVWNSGNYQSPATTGLTQTQIVTTDTYFAEVFIPGNTVVTGISLMNGHTTNAGVSLSVGLANSAGTIVAKSATTVAQSTADAYQQIPFTATYSAVGPAKYFIAVQGSTTTGYFASHTIGNFGATLITSETYGTFLTTASYATTTFTTARGPVCSTY